MLTKGQLEDAIAKRILRFEKEYIGRGPERIRAYIHSDMVIVRESDFLTLAEKKLAATAQGVDLIREMRVKLIDASRRLLCEIITELTGLEVIALHSDISIEANERMMVFSLSGDLEARLRQQSRLSTA